MSRSHDVDVLAVQRDGALVNALAGRGDLHDVADDPVARMLVAWVESIDAGLDDGRSWVVPEQERTPVPPDRRRGRAGLVAGVTAAVLVVSSGAAAAVTGDALAIVRAPIEVLGRVNPFVGGQEETKDAKSGLPEAASPVAGPNKLLADAQRALAQGDVTEAARLLAQAQGLLGDATNPGQQHRIDKLTAQLGSGNQGKGKDVNQGKSKDANQGKSKDANQGKSKDANQGKSKDVDQGKSKDVDQGKSKDVDQGKSKDVDQGTGTTQEPGTATSGNQGKQSTRAHGSEKPGGSSDATKVKPGGEPATSPGEDRSGQKT
jgi:hypothetical protein